MLDREFCLLKIRVSVVRFRPWPPFFSGTCEFTLSASILCRCQSVPITSSAAAAQYLSLCAPTVRKSANHLVDSKVLEEVTGKQRERIFSYESYANDLAQGTESFAMGA